MSRIYQAFLPQHTDSTHRLFAVVNRGTGEAVEALATFPTPERADHLADLLNLLAAGHPPTGVRERLHAALDGEPGAVRASIRSVVDDLNPHGQTLAQHLRRGQTAAFACFPVCACPDAGCGTCTGCTEDCVDCPTCADGGCDRCLPPVVTPRTALLLHAAGEILSDVLAEAQDDPDGWEEFPPFFQHLSSWAVDTFSDAFLDLAADLVHGVEPHPRSTAEEIALHLMTERANAELEIGAFDDELEQLPESRADYDWEQILDVLYQDSDYLGLMSNRAKLASETVVDMFERFTNMPEREYSATS